MTDGVPRLRQGKIIVRDLEQAQGVRALGPLLPEPLRRLLIGLDSRLVAAEAMVAVAEQVEIVSPLMALTCDGSGPGSRSPPSPSCIVMAALLPVVMSPRPAGV